MIFGKKLVSVPFAPYGVVLEDRFRDSNSEMPLNKEAKTMPQWLSRHSDRFVIERSLVQIQPGAYLEDSIKHQKC
jgi:hypothetical protein